MVFLQTMIGTSDLFKLNKTSQADYFATSEQTAAGEANIQIKKKEPASVWHFAVIAAVLAGIVYYASKELG